ncbi:MAG: hypothetical protein K2X77_22580 [Candidatus Obscuribacterales bacterium]|nr:hypothetical protein [Candidatus Obscuribacterales bacterium]
MLENKDLKNDKRSSNDKINRKPLPKAKELKNTQNDIVGGGAAAKMVTVAPCSGVFTGCGC